MISLLSSVLWLCYLQNAAAAVWPQPATYQTGSQVLWLSPSLSTNYNPANGSIVSKRRRAFPSMFEIYISAFFGVDLTVYRQAHRRQPAYGSSSTPVSSTDILESAIERMENNLKTTSLIPWKFNPKDANFEPPVNSNRTFISFINIELAANSNTTSNQTIDNEADESYSLTISTVGNVLIKINSAIGGVRALDTFTQLFYQHSDTAADVYTPLAPVFIQDSPTFTHRGVNLDISRNSISPGNVMHTLDAMSFNKFNRLHLHASDAQSWPIEIPALPQLAQNGAYQPGLSWSVADLEAVQAYGYLRGVQVYLEIDSPGHTAAIAYSFPDLISAFNEQPWSNYSAEPPSGQLKLNSPDVTNFITTLYDDLLPRVSPFASVFHTGGDEINANVYALDPTVNSADPTVIQPLLQAFVDHAHGIARSYGLTPIVWEETLLTWNLTLPKADTIIQTWIGQSSLDSVIASGHKALFGDYNHWYLDCGYGQWIDPNTTNTQTPITPPYADYCSPMKNWREVYSYDPTASYTAEQKEYIVGGEVHLFGELTDPTNLDGKLWPRAAAAAEVMWSGPKGVAGVDESATRRLAEMRERLILRGTEANMVQMTWCLQNIGDCSL